MCKTSEIKKKVLNLAEKSPKISSKTSFLLFFAYFLLYMTPENIFFLILSVMYCATSGQTLSDSIK